MIDNKKYKKYNSYTMLMIIIKIQINKNIFKIFLFILFKLW